ncbi:MAG: NAD(P)/FAD-dependent oxidoreductase [Limisphaerales bacterium]
MQRKRIVILGGGFGGLTLAGELEPLVKSKRAEVILIEQSPEFRMGFSMQWVLAGRRKVEAGLRAYSSLRFKRVQFIQDEAVTIQTGERTVQTKSRRIEYDCLVIALGAELAPELVPGLSEAAYNLCDFDSVRQFKSALQGLRSGTVLIAVAALPFKCPPAPYEYALLIDEVLRKRKIRNTVRVALSTPEGQPMPIAGLLIGEAVKKMLSERGIEYLPLHKLKLVEFPNRKVIYENGAEVNFDLLAATPPHRAPKVAREAGLADDSGFIPTELGSFKTAVPNVFAIGDIAALRLPNGNPHPKAGVFAEVQALALASQIAAEITGQLSSSYLGKGACFVDVGGGQAAPAEAELLHPDGPRFVLKPPSRAGLLAKKRFEEERFRKWFGK